MTFCIRKRSKSSALLFSYSENAPPRHTPRELILIFSATAAIFIFLK